MAATTRLPAPLSELYDWQLRAACRSSDPALFFSPEAERGAARQARAEAALRVCAACPVRRRCGEHALSAGEAYGVWGGMTEADRAARTAKERRALPAPASATPAERGQHIPAWRKTWASPE